MANNAATTGKENYYYYFYYYYWHCVKSQKVMSSIPDSVTGIFHWHNPSERSMAMVSTQTPTVISTRNTSWVKVAGL